jgi:hypothetical protein
MAEKTYKRISNGYVSDPVKYSNKIRNRLFALETKIINLSPLSRIVIDTEKKTIDFDGQIQFSDFKKIAKYIAKIQIILNRNEII